MTDGAVRFARYAVPPNSLGYCGVDEPDALVQLASARTAPADLRHLIRQFTGALPHLTEIARANHRRDVFGAAVIEAYWVGNRLLRHTHPERWADGLGQPELSAGAMRLLRALFGDTPDDAWQHHSYQVFGSMRRRTEFPDRLQAMDQCRIGWGCVERVEPGRLWIRRAPLLEGPGGVSLGAACVVSVRLPPPGLSNLAGVRPGAWVSTHWGWACERLSTAEVRNLAWATRHNLAQFWPEASPWPQHGRHDGLVDDGHVAASQEMQG